MRLTKKELSQYYILGKEIKYLEESLKRLEGQEMRSARLTGMPRGGGISDPVGDLASHITDIKAEIVHRKTLSLVARTKIERFINDIQDPELRLIIRMRHIDGLNWIQIASRLGNLHNERHYIHKYNKMFKA